MSDKPKFDPEKLSLIEFKMISGQIETPDDFIIEAVGNYDIENTLEMSFNLEQKLVKADYMIKIKTKSGGANKTESDGRYHFVYIYKVENIEDLAFLREGDVVDVDANLANAISAISYSTSRGILLTRMQGTAFQQFILPVIDPSRLLRTPDGPN